MEPVRVKLYGLVSMTRRGYLTQFVVSVGLAAVLFGLWWLHWPAVRERLRALDSSGLERIITFCDAAGWVLLVISVLLAVEAFVVLRMFARREAAAGKGPQPPSRP